MRLLNVFHFNCAHPVCSFILFSLKRNMVKIGLKNNDKMPSSRQKREKEKERHVCSVYCSQSIVHLMSVQYTLFKFSPAECVAWTYESDFRRNCSSHIIALACCFQPVPLNNLNKLFSDQISPDKIELCLKYSLFYFQGLGWLTVIGALSPDSYTITFKLKKLVVNQQCLPSASSCRWLCSTSLTAPSAIFNV